MDPAPPPPHMLSDYFCTMEAGARYGPKKRYGAPMCRVEILTIAIAIVGCAWTRNVEGNPQQFGARGIWEWAVVVVPVLWTAVSLGLVHYGVAFGPSAAIPPWASTGEMLPDNVSYAWLASYIATNAIWIGAMALFLFGRGYVPEDFVCPPPAMNPVASRFTSLTPPTTPGGSWACFDLATGEGVGAELVQMSLLDPLTLGLVALITAFFYISALKYTTK